MTIMASPVAGGAPRRILSDNGIWNLQCARTPSSLCMYSSQQGPKIAAFRFDINNGESNKVFSLLEHTGSEIIAAIPSPDGRSIAVDEFYMRPTTIWMRNQFQ